MADDGLDEFRTALTAALEADADTDIPRRDTAFRVAQELGILHLLERDATQWNQFINGDGPMPGG